MTLTESDLSELLAALQAGEMTDTIRTQPGVDPAAADRGGGDRVDRRRARTSGPRPARTSATGIGRGCCRRRRVMSSWRSPSSARDRSSRRCWSGAAGSTGRCSRW